MASQNAMRIDFLRVCRTHPDSYVVNGKLDVSEAVFRLQQDEMDAAQ